ncbi:MAG: CopD family protein [Bacteroidota bacterium]|nr:CopD family protein [Bacteroidota bacterium]
MYLYLKALHIIFVVTWFAGLFYMPRFFIYLTEAGEKSEAEKKILRDQLLIMTNRLWYIITWPSAILTLIFGVVVLLTGPWLPILFLPEGRWLLLKLIFVLLLYAYHFTIHKIYLQEAKGIYKYTSQQLRIWNEVATILLFAIVFLVTVKESISFVWGLIGLIAFIIILMSGIKIYKSIRNKK